MSDTLNCPALVMMTDVSIRKISVQRQRRDNQSSYTHLFFKISPASRQRLAQLIRGWHMELYPQSVYWYSEDWRNDE